MSGDRSAAEERARARLVTLFEIRNDRVERAEQRAHRAREELTDAVHAMTEIREELAAWDAAHPLPQGEMFPT
jgi:hypothetical protein